MKNFIVLIIVIVSLCSCDKEYVRITGKLNGFESSKVELSLRSKEGIKKVLLTDINVNDGKFIAILNQVKPPLKLTLVIDKEKEVDFWIFKYGTLNFELDSNNMFSLRLDDSSENAELTRVRETYDEMYLDPLRTQIDWVSTYENQELTKLDEDKLEKYKEQIDKAYRLRKKSILKTIRKNPQNPIAMALFYDEFNSLTSWQKEECLKISQKYYSDTEMNWQLRN